MSAGADGMPFADGTGVTDQGRQPKLMDRVREAIRVRHYSRRTEQAYAGWIRRFIVFHGTRHPREFGSSEVTAFLSSLATRGVSASTQNQALSAILFLYEVVVGERLTWMHDIVRAQRPVRLPVVLSRDEVASLLSRLRGPVRLMASLLYGAGRSQGEVSQRPARMGLAVGISRDPFLCGRGDGRAAAASPARIRPAAGRRHCTAGHVSLAAPLVRDTSARSRL